MFIILVLLFYTRNFYVCVPPMSQLTLLPMEFVYEGAEYIFGEPFFFRLHTINTLLSSAISRCTFFFPPVFFPRILSLPKNKNKNHRHHIICNLQRSRMCVCPSVRDLMDLSRDPRAGPGPTDSNYNIYVPAYVCVVPVCVFMCVCVILYARGPWADFSSSFRRQQRWRGRFTPRRNAHTGSSLLNFQNVKKKNLWEDTHTIFI